MPVSSPSLPPFAAGPEMAGRLLAWVASAAAGRLGGGDTAAARIAAALAHGTDGQLVAWPPDRPAQDVLVETALTALRVPDTGSAAGQAGSAQNTGNTLRPVAVLLPVPGDPAGAPARGAFAAAALEVGAAAIVRTPAGLLGWVPQSDERGSSYRGVHWQLYRIDEAAGECPNRQAADGVDLPPPDELESHLERADRELRRALRAAAQQLGELDLAHWRPETAAGRQAAEAALRTGNGVWPPGWPPGARALAERACGLWRLLHVAAQTPMALSSSGLVTRSEALRELDAVVRATLATAYTAPARVISEANGPDRG